jgi:uncharacterized membrane-anchored protein
MKHVLPILLLSLSIASSKTYAQESETLDSLMMVKMLDSIVQSFKWQTGTINLNKGMATINVPSGMRYLDAEQSNRVLTDLWGNPPSDNSLGMLFPADKSPISPDVIAFNISWEEMGYVKDDDADKINYDDLLKEQQKDAQEGSKQRVEMGYEAIEIVGWASKPYYDKNSKVLHWAKEIKFGAGEAGNTLNYDVRVLGRKGVLSMNAIGDIASVDVVKGLIPGVINSVNFNEGHRYADFDSKVDDVAAWTIGGLVAGKVLAKAGFFAIILKFIKPILFALVAFGGVIWKFITGRKKEEEEEVVETNETAPEAENSTEATPPTEPEPK